MLKVDSLKKPLPIYTPTKWQTVLLRLYGLISNEKLGEVLRANLDTIEREIKRLGIDKIKFCPSFCEKGYITILRAVWNVLPYSQILNILNIDQAELEFRLKEDDFLSVKLGDKPDLEQVFYYPLSAEEIKQTEYLASIIKSNFIDGYADYFEFYSAHAGEIDNSGCERIVYDYSSSYGDLFLEGDNISENQLSLLAQKGVNGLWFQGVLSKLSPYPFKKGLDLGFETRRQNLNKLIDKCAKYNIKVYLYINEPRALNKLDFLPEFNEFMGTHSEDEIALCTSHKTVQNYLFDAIYSLSKACPKLGGFITITMSENLTNCYSNANINCERCKNREKPEVVSQVSNIIQSAVTASNSRIKVIANLWGWTKGLGWSDEQIEQGVSLLDSKIEIMCVSELGTHLDGTEEKYVAEYSLSQIGPSLESKRMLELAKEKGHKTWAKVQINSSWEYSTVPYVPVYDLIIEHISNHIAIKTDAFMLSWTLGGYPSASLDLVNKLLKGDFNYDNWLQDNYGERFLSVKTAVQKFCSGFKKIPYDWTLLYNGPEHVGFANPLYLKKTDYQATMVGIPYDDLDSWLSAPTEQEFIDALTLMTCEWQQGLEILEKAGFDKFDEIYRYAKMFYLGYMATLNQSKFILERTTADKQKLLELVELEQALTKQQYELACIDSKLGFEASNHYFYTQNTYLEKFLNLEKVKKEIDKC